MKPLSWLPKALSGLIGGACHAVLIMAIIGTLCHSTNDPRSLSAQLLMWLSVLTGLTCISASFAFSSAWRAWLYLGGSTVCLSLIFLVFKASHL